MSFVRYISERWANHCIKFAKLLPSNKIVVVDSKSHGYIADLVQESKIPNLVSPISLGNEIRISESKSDTIEFILTNPDNVLKRDSDLTDIDTVFEYSLSYCVIPSIPKTLQTFNYLIFTTLSRKFIHVVELNPDRRGPYSSWIEVDYDSVFVSNILGLVLCKDGLMYKLEFGGICYRLDHKLTLIDHPIDPSTLSLGNYQHSKFYSFREVLDINTIPDPEEMVGKVLNKTIDMLKGEYVVPSAFWLRDIDSYSFNVELGLLACVYYNGVSIWKCNFDVDEDANSISANKDSPMEIVITKIIDN